MIRRSRREWAEIIAEFERSGEKRDEFCERRKLNTESFRAWLYRLRGEAKSGTAARSATDAVKMLPVRVREATPALVEVVASTGCIRVPVGIDVAYVAELARALAIRC